MFKNPIRCPPKLPAAQSRSLWSGGIRHWVMRNQPVRAIFIPQGARCVPCSTTSTEPPPNCPPLCLGLIIWLVSLIGSHRGRCWVLPFPIIPNHSDSFSVYTCVWQRGSKPAYLLNRICSPCGIIELAIPPVSHQSWAVFYAACR